MTIGLGLVCEGDDDAEDVGRDVVRIGLTVVMGASPRDVFSYRMATRFMSSRNEGRRTGVRLFWRTLPNLGVTAMAMVDVW
jgi:hypothetical protein